MFNLLQSIQDIIRTFGEKKSYIFSISYQFLRRRIFNAIIKKNHHKESAQSDLPKIDSSEVNKVR